jgi:hypothetical protein
MQQSAFHHREAVKILKKMTIAEKMAHKYGQQGLLYKQGLFCTVCCKESDLQPAVAPV